MNFQIRAIDHHKFNHLFDLSDAELAQIRAQRISVDVKPGYPCRVSLQDANIGETIIAFPYKHHDVDSPYYNVGPVFIRNNVKTAELKINEIPQMLINRELSIRAYDKNNMMIDATITQGQKLQATLVQLLNNHSIHYLHIHNANPGCFNCYVERAN